MNLPSINPADNGSLAGTLQFAFGKLMQSGVEGMLPAKVIAYDRTTNRVQVQILIAIVGTDGTQTPRQQVASIPVLQFGGGGYLLNFPLNPGNLGWIAANDRDISLFLQSYTDTPPNSGRMFSFSDGLFIPDVMTGYTISAGDAGNAVLQNLDGTVKISLTPTGVVITGGMTIVGGMSGSGGSLTFTGNLNVVGNITATGDITPHV